MAHKILSLLVALVIACDGGSRSTPQVDPAFGAGSPPRTDIPAVVFLGTSLTAGLGVDPEAAYPAVIGRRLDSLGMPYRVVNAGVSGETSAGGLRRLDWLLREPVAVLVVELGANDGLRGLPPEAMKTNLDEIVRRTRAAHPDAEVVLAGMEAPPNMGERYTEAFRRVFRDLAREHGVALIPFLLDGVAGVPALNQADGIHPTAEGHRIIAETVWKVLEEVLARRAADGGERP